jgi:hypothetical protein
VAVVEEAPAGPEAAAREVPAAQVAVAEPAPAQEMAVEAPSPQVQKTAVRASADQLAAHSEAVLSPAQMTADRAAADHRVGVRPSEPRASREARAVLSVVGEAEMR